MEFSLYYKGILKSNGSKKDKHEIRMFFHNQIEKLWTQEPLINFKSFLESKSDAFSREINGFTFSSIINKDFHLIADLDIILLRPEPIGNIIKTGGDIDNRLKTLFDALKMPSNFDELPNDLDPKNMPKTRFCLLHDDSLINSIKISTRQFLGSGINNNEVILLIDVNAKKISTMLGGMELP